MNFFKNIIYVIKKWHWKITEERNEMLMREAIQDPIPERHKGKQIMRSVCKEKKQAKKEANKRAREAEKA